MKMAGYQPPTRNEYAPLFHRTLRDTVQTLIRVDDEKEIKRVCDLIDVAEAPPPIITEGAFETVKELSKGYALAVVTSRIKAYAYEPPLDTLESYFKAMVAYEDTQNHKPNPKPLLLAASQLGVRPQECIYVGDAESDLVAAHAAGMKFILYSKEKIDGADASTPDFGKIVGLVQQLS